MTMIFNSVTRVDVEVQNGQIYITQGDANSDPHVIIVNPENIKMLVQALGFAADQCMAGEDHGG